MEIKFKADYEKGINDFIGREDELEHIQGLLQSKFKGSVLISGERGIGKTQLIRYVVEKVAKKRSLIPIYINFNQLEVGAVKINPETILENIIRLTYYEVKDQKGILGFQQKKDIENLYKKVTGKYLKEELSSDTSLSE